MKRSWLLPVFLLSLAFLAACAPAPVLRDDTLLKDLSLIEADEDCSAPCWRGITPGETSWSDALTVIEDDPQLVDVQTETDDSGARLAMWTEEGGPECCRMYSMDGEVVSAILLLLAPEMTVGQVVDNLGEPEYALGESVSDDQAIVSLIYPDKQSVVYAFAAGVEAGEVSDSSEVIGSIFMNEEDITSLLSSTDLYNWEGYGPYALYAEGDFDHTAVPEETDGQ